MTVTRADRCTACGRPTYVGEDFDGPCVHDTDLACALAQRDEAVRLAAADWDSRESVEGSERLLAQMVAKARAERDRLIGHGCDGDTVNACGLLDLYHQRTVTAERERDNARRAALIEAAEMCEERARSQRLHSRTFVLTEELVDAATYWVSADELDAIAARLREMAGEEE